MPSNVLCHSILIPGRNLEEKSASWRSSLLSSSATANVEDCILGITSTGTKGETPTYLTLLLLVYQCQPMSFSKDTKIELGILENGP